MKNTLLIIALLVFALSEIQAKEYDGTKQKSVVSPITVKSKIKVLYKTVRPAIEDHKTLQPGNEDRKNINMVDTMELYTGGSCSLYQTWNKDLKDSLLNVMKDKVNIASKGHPITVVYSEFQFKKITKSDKFANWDENWETERLYKDYHKNKFFYVDYLKKQWMMAERDVTAPKWKIETETSTILGYLCHKATASFLGREYTAWFTEDIPLQDGPWLFSGLPGLIMKVEDSTNQFSFEAVGIEKLKKTIIKNISQIAQIRNISYKDYYEYKLGKEGETKYYYAGSDGITYYCDIDNPIKVMPIEINKK